MIFDPFSRCLDEVQLRQNCIQGDYLLDEMMPAESENPFIYIEDREISWPFFLNDIEQANKSIRIEFPDVMQEDDEAAEQFSEILLRSEEES